MTIDGPLIKSLLLNLSEDFIGNVTNLKIQSVFTDSRKQVTQALFIPLVGDRFDGHHYILQAIESGASAAIWEKGKPLPDELPDQFPIFFVEDTLGGLQRLAHAYLHKLQPIVVGITGSNGKTTTKDIVESICRQGYRTHKTEGNFNNHIGLPLTILSMPKMCDILILEMGMNHAGEISVLSNIAEPDFAIITNIGESHIEYLGSREGIANAKLEIVDGFNNDSQLIIDGDERLLKERIKNSDTKVIHCGYDEANHYAISNVVSTIDGCAFTINQNEHYHIPLLGQHNVKNAAYAIALGKALKLSADQIQIGLDELTITGMRLQTLSCPDGTTVINDAYNASPTSMMAAIETIKGLPDYQRRIAVLGDMYELGTDEEALHRSVAESIGEPITDIVTVGNKAAWIADEYIKNAEHSSIAVHICESKDQAEDFLKQVAGHDTLILFKASRAVKLETIVQTMCC